MRIFKKEDDAMNDIHHDATGASGQTSPLDAGMIRAQRHLTSVRTFYREGRQNYRVLFGEPVRTHRIARAEGFTVMVLKFSAAPGSRLTSGPVINTARFAGAASCARRSGRARRAIGFPWWRRRPSAAAHPGRGRVATVSRLVARARRIRR